MEEAPAGQSIIGPATGSLVESGGGGGGGGGQPAAVNYYSGESARAASRQEQLEASLSEDISRIIQQESAAISAPDSLGSMQQAAASLSLAGLPLEQPALGARQQQQQRAKELRKFDYDIIQSSSSPNLVQLNDLSGELANQQQATVQPMEPLVQPQQHRQHPAQAQQQQPQQQQQHYNQRPQMLTQIDFVPHQHHQTQAARQVTPALPMQPGANPMRAQVERLGRSPSVGEPSQLAGSTASSSSKAHGEPAATDRVPIYRSLFKSLKGNSKGGANGPTHLRYSVAGANRRRRDRLAMGGGQAAEDGARGQHPSSAAPSTQGYGDGTSSSGSSVALGQQSSANQTGPAQRAHGVASYLQLLNSRYNLRMARVSPAQTGSIQM